MSSVLTGFPDPYLGQTMQIGVEIDERDDVSFTLSSCTVTIAEEASGTVIVDDVAGTVDDTLKRMLYVEEFSVAEYVALRRYVAIFRGVVAGTEETPTRQASFTVKAAADA